MCLGVSTSMAEDIGHSGSGIREVVGIDFKLVLQLKLPIVEYRVSPVCKQWGVRDLHGAR